LASLAFLAAGMTLAFVFKDGLRPASPPPAASSPAPISAERRPVAITHHLLSAPRDPEDVPRGDELVDVTVFDTPGHPRVVGDSIESVVDGVPQRLPYRPYSTQPGWLKVAVRLPHRGARHSIVLMPVYDLTSIGGTGIARERMTGLFDAQGRANWSYESVGAAQMPAGARQSGPVELGQ
jgi:hypothetical protein